MSIFQQLGGGQQQDPRQAVQQIKADPAGFLKQAGVNVPGGMTDPRQIINHLLQTGQVGNAKYQQVLQMMGQMRR